jgi:transcriptional regulator with XRE-family HTH domain
VLSRRLGELRMERGFTQLELAERINIGRASVSNYENGDRVPDADILIKFADLFGVTTDYLLGRSEFKSFDQDSKYRRRVSIKSISQDTDQSILLVQVDESYSKIIKQITLNNESRFAKYSLKSMDKLFKMINYLSEILRESKYDDEMFLYVRFLTAIKNTDVLINDLGRIQPNQTHVNACVQYFTEFITNFVYLFIDLEKEKPSVEE